MPVPHWWWVCNAPPNSRISVLDQQAEPSEEPLVLPGPGAGVSFAAHVKPLFQARDRQSMRFAFDLWSYPDVVKHADVILDQVRAGSMPCDSVWPTEHTEDSPAGSTAARTRKPLVGCWGGPRGHRPAGGIQRRGAGHRDHPADP
jgi:hypothetical protein